MPPQLVYLHSTLSPTPPRGLLYSQQEALPRGVKVTKTSSIGVIEADMNYTWQLYVVAVSSEIRRLSILVASQ